MEDKTNLTNVLQSYKTLTLNSQCKLAFIKNNNSSSVIPVLMITGEEGLGGDSNRIWSSLSDAHIGIFSTEVTNDNQLAITITAPQCDNVAPYISEQNTGDWLLLSEQDLNNNNYSIIYPRVFINSLGLKTTSDELVLKYHDASIENPVVISDTLALIKPYEDYSILTRSLNNQYVLTLNNNLIFKNNLQINNNSILFNDQPLRLNYSISNADVSIYLDALEVAKENSQPKVAYNLTAELVNPNLIETIFNKMGYITNINDYDLKFKNVQGYISGFTLDLDDPSQDTIEVKNYKNKFQDLFSTITAQTEAMKKNSYTLQLANAAFTSTGQLSQEVLQSSIMKVDLNYAFNNGKLTIDQKNGIWGTSDNGVVAFRGGGIFTATEKDTDDNWKWNTGITPEGINADLITSGQLDTNLIKIYAGDHLRFQMNGDGIFAYKTWISDSNVGQVHPLNQDGVMIAQESLDQKQYVVFNENGLSLVAKKGAKVLTKNHNQYYTVLDDDFVNDKPELMALDSIKRVEVSWDGFVLRNWENTAVFFADAETGNLTLKGRIEANSGRIGTWRFDNNKMWSAGGIDTTTNAYKTYVVLNAGGSADGDILMNDNEQPIYTDSQGNPVLVVTKDYCFWAGSPIPTDAAFSIRKDGFIKATAGTIGGWYISTNYLYSNQITLAGSAMGSLNGNEVTFSPTTTSGGTDDDIQLPSGITSSSPSTKWIKPTIFAHPASSGQDLSKSIFIVSDDGNVLAKDFYLLTHNGQGIIEKSESISSWIQSVQESLNDVAETASSALRTARGRVLNIKFDGGTLYYCYKTDTWETVPGQ